MHRTLKFYQSQVEEEFLFLLIHKSLSHQKRWHIQIRGVKELILASLFKRTI